MRGEPSFLLLVWALVLRTLGVAVLRGERALVGVEHVLGLGDVGHLVGEVIRRGVPRLSDFVPEPRTSPGRGEGGVGHVAGNCH